MFRPVRNVAAPGTKSAVSDCILLGFEKQKTMPTLHQQFK